MLFHMSQREKKGEGDGKYMSVFHTRKLFANQPVSNQSEAWYNHLYQYLNSTLVCDQMQLSKDA